MDREQFAQQFDQTYDRLWMLAASIMVDRVAADDVVQEAALVGLSKLDEFQAGTSFLAWMSQIVRLTAWNQTRKRRRRRTFAWDPEQLDHAGNGQTPPHAPRPVRVADLLAHDQPHFDDQLLAALRTLGEVARSCLLLRVVLQLSYAEIAQLLQLPEGTAMSHVHRAKRALRKSLVQGAQATKSPHGREA